MHADKFGEVIPTGPKAIHPNRLNFAQDFEFLFFPHFFFGTSKLLD